MTSVASGALRADPVACPGNQFSTENAGEHAGLICALADRAARQLASCELTVPTPVTINVVPSLTPDCLGLYHCGEGRIDILAPDAYAALQDDGDVAAFAGVSPAAFFESIIRHELVHAALETMPCPFSSCIVAQEYVAYTMQVRFMPETDRAAFEAVEPHDGPVAREVLNPMILMMAPDVFARRAWQHLNERPDPCGFIGKIARGEVLLDQELP